jgi:hypothetical protein
MNTSKTLNRENTGSMKVEENRRNKGRRGERRRGRDGCNNGSR